MSATEDRGAATPAPRRPNPLLIGPILSTLLRLALPNVASMAIFVVVGVAETWTIGELGTEPLAAMAVVFPFAMLVGMLSAGAMGGGVSSAVSRALGASNLDRARAAAVHALVIGAIAGVLHSVVMLSVGPALYRLLGARGPVLDLAVGYATWVFAGAVLVWLSNTLASIVRGTGNMKVPSAVIFTSAGVQIVVGMSLGLGLGPFPRLGMPGVALGQVVSSAMVVAVLGWYLLAGRGALAMRAGPLSLQRALFADILKVGALACLSPLQTVLTILIFTGLFARLGVQALAGYGIGQRLEFMLMPIAFGVGVAAVPMVGMAIGSGDVLRARRVAWTAGAVSAAGLGLLGLLVAALPDLWAGFFTDDPRVLASARQYLRWAGPCFAFLGLGATLYFASQGSGHMLGPVLASSVRLLVVAGVGFALKALDAPPSAYFALVALAMFTYGAATAAAVRYTSWGAPSTKPS
jgi:putative MATE family efflux protein